jgi:DNA-binding transcriptional ArsR family regulator
VHGEVRLNRYVDGRDLRRRYRALPGSLSKVIASVDAGYGFNWSDLVGLVPKARRPRGLRDLRRVLSGMDPLDLKLAMLGYHVLDYRRAIGDELFREAAAGNRRAVRRFRLRANKSPRAGVDGPLLALRPELVAERTLAILDSLPAAFYQAHPDTARLLAAGSRQAAALARGVDPSAVVERMTRGIVYAGEAGVDTLLVIPTIIHRPWSLVLDFDSSKIFCYPVYPGQAGADRVDPQLAGLYRALGDETRLRLLKRLAAGRATFGQLSKEMGLAKSTLHQHALILRTAGLVRLHLSSGSGLELNPRLPRLDRLLKDFLGSGVTTDS